MKKKLSLVLLLLCLTVGLTFALYAQKRRPPTKVITSVSATTDPVYTPEIKRRVDSFDLAWQTIKNNYFDSGFSGLDWDKIRLEFRPRVVNSKTDREFHALLQEMIGRLNRSHFEIIIPEVYEEIEKAKAVAKSREKMREPSADKKTSEPDETEGDEDEDDSGMFRYGVGLDLRIINDQFIVTRVQKESSGEKSGIKPGYVIEAVNGISLTQLLDRLRKENPSGGKTLKYLAVEVVRWFLDGYQDTQVNITFLDESDHKQELLITRERLNGRVVSLGKNFPEQFFNYESKALDEKTGYIRFNLFALPVIEKFCNSLSEFSNKKAIIIDLRGNPGGMIGVIIGLSGMLSDKPFDLGTQIYRSGVEPVVAFPKSKNFKGKLVFLIDSLSISSSEVFTAAMKENGRAVVVGQKSAGEALPALSVSLPTRAVLIYPIANFRTPKGNLIEGSGVEPDITVGLDRKSLLNGVDSQLDKAIKVAQGDEFIANKANKELGKITAIDSDEDPPPPKAKPTPPPVPRRDYSGPIAPVDILAAPAASDEKAEGQIDVKAKEIIDQFVSKVGGADALKKLSSYSLKGKTTLFYRGADTELGIIIFRRKEDKYAEILSSDSVGEVREVYNGKSSFVQADYGLYMDTGSTGYSANKREILAPINNMIVDKFFRKLKYQGVFDRQRQQVILIEGTTIDNENVAVAFDAETKMLVSYAGKYSTISFGDYRKAGDLNLPFSIVREGLMKIMIDTIKINPEIDESNFLKKISCFDKEANEPGPTQNKPQL